MIQQCPIWRLWFGMHYFFLFINVATYFGVFGVGPYHFFFLLADLNPLGGYWVVIWCLGACLSSKWESWMWVDSTQYLLWVIAIGFVLVEPLRMPPMYIGHCSVAYLHTNPPQWQFLTVYWIVSLMIHSAWIRHPFRFAFALCWPWPLLHIWHGVLTLTGPSYPSAPCPPFCCCWLLMSTSTCWDC